MRRAALLGAAAAAALAAPAARAHEVLHTVERNRAVAVKAFFADGEALAYTQYEVYSPSDPNIPHQKGRTDQGGWLAFVPDSPGKWRVKVVDDTGHGLEVEIEAAPTSATGTPPAAAPTSPAAILLRPLLGVATIAAVFGLIFAFFRRKGTTP